MSWGSTFHYSWTPPEATRRVTTSRTEVLHIGIAYAVLTGCLLLVFSGNTLLASGFAPPGLGGISLALVAVAALAALSGFVAHELAHKVVAERLGFWAEFRASSYGLLMAVVTSILGFILAAPGATVVGGMSDIDRRSWGRTSLAGPMTNLGFATLFYAVSIVPFEMHSTLFEWLLLLAFINAWFGTFNLFPFGVLDGRKVFRWNVGIWSGAIALTIAMLALCAIALYISVSPLLGY